MVKSRVLLSVRICSGPLEVAWLLTPSPSRHLPNCLQLPLSVTVDVVVEVADGATVAWDKLYLVSDPESGVFDFEATVLFARVDILDPCNPLDGWHAELHC